MKGSRRGEIGKHRFGPGEWRLGVDEPILPLEWSEVRDKGLAATQAGEVATERQLTRRVAVGEPRQEEPAEQARKLLYIEDNEDNLYMLQLRFDVLGGYEVLGARSHRDRDGGDRAARCDPNGSEPTGNRRLDTARRLKADPGTRHIPIIALSAHAMADNREKALAAGCDDFDTKPVEFNRLLAKIDQALAPETRESGS